MPDQSEIVWRLNHRQKNLYILAARNSGKTLLEWLIAAADAALAQELGPEWVERASSKPELQLEG